VVEPDVEPLVVEPEVDPEVLPDVEPPIEPSVVEEGVSVLVVEHDERAIPAPNSIISARADQRAFCELFIMRLVKRVEGKSAKMGSSSDRFSRCSTLEQLAALLFFLGCVLTGLRKANIFCSTYPCPKTQPYK
jgi:hypothetical protein